MLKTHKKEQNELILLQEEYDNKNYIFCNKSGKSIKDKRPGRNLKTILTSIGLESIKFHALRHTYSTILFDAGIPSKTVQHLMNHADIETILNIYTHVIKEQKLETVEKINNIFT